ncbi:MAG: zinc-ribbon domain-containing protein [Ruminococcaceae bacterium]|nr:zinc-ribbon domain-containing protein [Oscillospiraceae bacterium]
MANCSKCGTLLPENANHCPQCGTAQQAYYTQYTPAPPKKRKLSTLWLVISIINIVFIGSGIGLVLGIVGLVFTILATQTKSDEQEANFLKISKIVNIVALVILGMSLLATVGVFLASLGTGLLSAITAISVGLAGAGDIANFLDNFARIALPMMG